MAQLKIDSWHEFFDPQSNANKAFNEMVRASYHNDAMPSIMVTLDSKLHAARI